MTSNGRQVASRMAMNGPLPPCNSPLCPRALVQKLMPGWAQDMPDWQSRSPFFGMAVHLMRKILADEITLAGIEAPSAAEAKPRSLGMTHSDLLRRVATIVALADELTVLDEMTRVLASQPEMSDQRRRKCT